MEHSNDKTHMFYSDTHSVIREWMKALMKSTIERDYSRKYNQRPMQMEPLLKPPRRTRQFNCHCSDNPIGRRPSHEPPSTTSVTKLPCCYPESDEEAKPQSTLQ